MEPRSYGVTYLKIGKIGTLTLNGITKLVMAVNGNFRIQKHPVNIVRKNVILDDGRHDAQSI